MLSGGRIIRLLIVVLACVALWKVWDYIGWGKSRSFETHGAPIVPIVDSNAQVNDAAIPGDHDLEVDVDGGVPVQVFYEPLCPDSKNFVKSQLAPVMEKIGDKVNLALIPYGKARTTDNGGTYTFECQHGPVECLGNKVHGCVLKNVPDTRLQTKIVTCMISNNRKPKKIAQKCVEKHLGTGHWAPIQACYTSREGDLILKHNGDLTHALNPPLTYVPTVTINGSRNDMNEALGNFLAVVCRNIKGEKPAECV